jgi:hypothetical protein
MKKRTFKTAFFVSPRAFVDTAQEAPAPPLGRERSAPDSPDGTSPFSGTPECGRLIATRSFQGPERGKRGME